MKDWIKLEDKNPENDCMCYVCDANSNAHCFLAMYNKYINSFTQYDPSLREHPSLKVSHYIVLPWCSPEQEK